MALAEESEVANAGRADVVRRDTLHLARRGAVEPMHRFGVGMRHEFIVGERARKNRRREVGVLLAHLGTERADVVVAVQTRAPLAHDCPPAGRPPCAAAGRGSIRASASQAGRRRTTATTIQRRRHALSIQ
jgi:hypothetical protein